MADVQLLMTPSCSLPPPYVSPSVTRRGTLFQMETSIIGQKRNLVGGWLADPQVKYYENLREETETKESTAF